MAFNKRTGLSYSGLSSSQESLDEYDRFNSEDIDFDIKLAKFPKPKGLGTRHTLVLMGFLGFIASYAMRVNMAFAINAMVKNSVSSISGNTSNVACPHNIIAEETNNSNDDTGAEFDWSTEDQGDIIGAFFWSYVIVQIPAGMLAERVGGKWPYGLGILITGVLCVLSPVVARTGSGSLMVLRCVQGFADGLTNPSMHMILAKWLPPFERNKLGAFVYTGQSLGLVITMPICGILIHSGFLGGWPSGFYVIGTLSIVWFVFWTFLVFDTPAEHPRIEANELDYIRNSIGGQTSKYKIPIPWTKIFTSMPVLALLIIMTGNNWGSTTLITELPMYMKNILHFDIQSNGFVSAIPHFMHWIVSVFSCWLADYLREHNIMSTTSVRKLFNTVGHWIPAIGFICVAYNGCNRIWAVILLTTINGINGVVVGGFLMNHVDLSPNQAGILMGITNAFGNLAGVFVPYIVGFITSTGQTLGNWQLVFLIAAGVFIFDNLFYLIFGSGEEQSWNRYPTRENSSEKIETADNLPLIKTPSFDTKKSPVLMVKHNNKRFKIPARRILKISSQEK